MEWERDFEHCSCELNTTHCGGAVVFHHICELLPENSERKKLRSAGCIIGEMMNSTPLFPDASEIQVPSTGHYPRQEWSFLGKSYGRLFQQSAFLFFIWTEKGNQLWVFSIIFGRFDASTKPTARQVLRKIRNRCCVFNQDPCDAVWDSTITTTPKMDGQSGQSLFFHPIGWWFRPPEKKPQWVGLGESP